MVRLELLEYSRKNPREDLQFPDGNKEETLFQICATHHIWKIDFKTLQHPEPLDMSEDLGPSLLPEPATRRCHLQGVITSARFSAAVKLTRG